jgi:hypothetical protein
VDGSSVCRAGGSSPVAPVLAGPKSEIGQEIFLCCVDKL